MLTHPSLTQTPRQRWHPERHALPLPTNLLDSSASEATTTRAAMLTREAVESLGLLRPVPPGEGAVIAEGGEARLLLLLEGDGAGVRKVYRREAMGKALKELQALLAAGAHLPDSADEEDGAVSSSSSCCCPNLVRLQGVEWPVDSPRPTALVLERAHTDLRRFLQRAGEQRPLPLPQLVTLALGLAAAVGRLHASGLCHKDIHRSGSSGIWGDRRACQ